MTESVLKSIMRLFAIVSNLRAVISSEPDDNSLDRTREITASYLEQLVNPTKTSRFLDIFEFHFRNLKKRPATKSIKRISLYSVKTLLICEQLNENLSVGQKSFVLLQLIDILKSNDNIITNDSIDLLNTIASTLSIPSDDYDSMYLFIFGNKRNRGRHNSLLIISAEKDAHFFRHHLYRENLSGSIVLLYLQGSDTYYLRPEEIDDALTMNGKNLNFNKIYLVEKGANIRCPKISTIYYGDITGKFLYMQSQNEVQLLVSEIEYSFKNSDNGIKKFSFVANSGQLVGIMGGSGVGKSTLLNMLNGSQEPQSGCILLNGYDIYKEQEMIEGLVGFIPQDDFLIEELTVFENLYFNARFCFSSYTEEKIREKVDQWLFHLNLKDISDLKVGSSLNKLISGGQRKRLNIALELLREPSVLFVDEPTSGLSSNDSEKVMELLKQQTYNGKLVMVNIHQPSSDIFKMFDSLLVLDKGGRCVYYGKAIDALMYFRNATQQISAGESECIWCGNLNPEQILQIIEMPKVSKNGQPTNERQVRPEQWHQMFLNSLSIAAKPKILLESLPKTNFNLPSRFKQFALFFERNVKCKIADHQYMLVNILEAPLLALILGFFTRYAGGPNNTYLFSENINIPSFIFMSVVVALFIGMMGSAEEIIKDAKIHKREAFLHLSRLGYLHSKIIYLFLVSAIQMAIYIIISQKLLDMRDMHLTYWLVMFSTAACANMIGLILSAGMQSVVAIYILIPLILIPQLLLNGVIVKYDKLHAWLKSDEYVPVIGDLMPSRWAYEAITVEQFANNEYQKHFFEFDRTESQSTYILNFLIPELSNKLDMCQNSIGTTDENKVLRETLPLFKREINKLSVDLKISGFKQENKLVFGKFDNVLALKTGNYLKYARTIASKVLNYNIEERDKFTHAFAKKLNGQEQLLHLKEQYYNNSLADQLLNKNEQTKLNEINKKFYRKYEPVYLYPESRIGRAHYYSPVKKIGNNYISTFWFNIIAIWLFVGLFYILLIFNILGRIIKFIRSIQE